MVNIKSTFKHRYGKTLGSFIKVCRRLFMFTIGAFYLWEDSAMALWNWGINKASLSTDINVDIWLYSVI